MKDANRSLRGDRLAARCSIPKHKESGSMINEHIRYRIPADKEAAFVADYAKAGEFLRASPVCQVYELSRCEEEPECFILRILWSSTSDHLNVFRASEAFRGFLPLIRPYMGNIEEMRHYQATEVAWRRG
jgi:quinol monooxygenase YgiN